ncbi:hypothetical protein [Xylophilus sp.]|uniref:hypothetical protein n=1 Tax=Xylophilus sp. TaxID=2653893 RepID=UPI0013BDA1C8|nr:hypothetical protein [Xylophilus sp.]KAF1046866.1 MAG: hypothetical protein GAK38_02265 [Xylophilus sp.]
MAADAWWLLQARLPRIDGLHAAAQAAADTVGARLHRAAWAASTGEAYAYVRAAAADAGDALAAAFARHASTAEALRVSPLEPVFDVPGASAGAQPLFHYVVETDPEEGWFDEIGRWYDTEHMPGLAAVPGNVRAMRFLNRGHGPLSLACYDLVTDAALTSAPWLAVRATAWSDIARPHFTNTRRTMFEVAYADAGSRPPRPSAARSA